MPRWTRYLTWPLGIGLLLVAAGLIASFFLGRYEGVQATVASLSASLTPIQETVSSSSLVHPLLAYRTPEATTLGQYQALNNSLQGAVDSAKSGGGATQVSVYFRDLNSGLWLGINQTADYYPASLLKVPVMIAFYKEAESNPSILNQQVVYQDIAMPDPFDATSTLVVGQSYTINQLINQMIITSDNGATFTLLGQIDPTVLDQVYTDLGIPDPDAESATYQISTRTYALFFRILYNATYLSDTYSEKALDLLSQATFTDGLVAGTPSGTTIAHKFGEHVLTNASGTTATGVELSDCGVVYYPSHPYLLCVMTSASDLPTASSIIKNISQITYAAVNQEYATATSSK